MYRTNFIQPYFWVYMLRWSFTDQQVSYECRFPENVNQSYNMEAIYLYIYFWKKGSFKMYFFLPPNFKICALRDLVPFVQFKKREKHLWRSVTFSEVAGNIPPWVFFTFLNCAHGTKSCNAPHIISRDNWTSRSLKFMILSAFFLRIINLLTVLIFWAQIIQK